MKKNDKKPLASSTSDCVRFQDIRKTNNNPPDNPEQRIEKTPKQRCPADNKRGPAPAEKIASQRQEWIAFTAEINRTAEAARPDDQASGRH
ncbi:hypothetical protein ElyMa_005441000 [Elysia marginata]|uniref:Uncharacterized protein n=1 Tax=Elysia marginata TaxID=1093978 RepID=A0AAV4ENP5_9GAST|nr:hypothetical protein ElyMa_005441000 [Elysia marginata]